MFIRIKTTSNSPKRAVQIVSSYRDGKKVRQRILRHVGTALDDKELQSMRELAEHIKATMEQERQPGLFAPDTLARMAIEVREGHQQDPLCVDLKKILAHTENDNKYGIPSKKTIQAEKIYQLMGLKISDVPFQIC